MLKVLNANTGVGSEVKLRDYSEPLQNQRDISSYASRYVYNFDFGIEPDITDLHIYENQMIRIWRAMANNPYIKFAIDDIINEMISYNDEDKYPIDLDLNDTKFSKNIRKKIHDEWMNVMKLLMFHKKAYTLLRDWYIDGKQYFYVEEGKDGIKSVTVLDPLRTKKIVNKDENYSYVYHDTQLNNVLFEIPAESMVELPSGLMDDRHNIWISYLNNAYIPLNQLNNIEDALLIYRIARAPERRVFYIDTGQLPKSKAETYMKEVVRQLRNKMEYDPATGKIKETSNNMSLLDDIYLPRSAEGRSTEVSTLQGNGNFLGQTDDLDYFKIKLFRSLNVPFTRWSELNGPANVIGRSAELTRDEVKYRKFIVRLRKQYEAVFTILLRKQLALKNIIKESEFNEEYENIMFVWATDSFFAELRDIEVMNERLNIVDRVTPNVGIYFSTHWVMKDILRFTDEDIDQMREEIKEEKKSGQQMPNDDPTMDAGDYQGMNKSEPADTDDEPSDDDELSMDKYLGTDDKEKEEESILYERRVKYV